MRDRLRAELGTVQYPDFLCYIMGPYETIASDAVPTDPATERSPSPTNEADDAEHSPDGPFALLRRTQGALRANPGVNAFLAVDAGISLESMDAATQSIRFARASNVVAFVVPRFGDNLGVGLEAGAVLETQFPDSDRLLIVHEAAVTSAMLDAVTRRWDASVVSYANEAELVDQLREFIAQIMYQEFSGALSLMDE